MNISLKITQVRKSNIELKLSFFKCPSSICLLQGFILFGQVFFKSTARNTFEVFQIYIEMLGFLQLFQALLVLDKLF